MEKVDTRDLQPGDIRAILVDPTFAFGIKMWPENELVQWMETFSKEIPDHFWLLSASVQKDIYLGFFHWLQTNYIKLVRENLPTLVTIEDWLSVQKRLREEIESIDIFKARCFQSFIQAMIRTGKL